MVKKVFLVVAPGRQSTEALHFALHKAKETKGTLRVIYIIDAEIIGEDTQRELHGKKVLEEVEKQARTFQVPVESGLKTGDYVDICLELSHGKDVGILILTQKKTSFLKKVFETSETNKLKDRVSCEIKIYHS